jgi:hypothetical protein
MSRFAAVTAGVIDTCQNGLGTSIPGLDASLVAVITEESLEADSLLTRSSQELLALDFEGLSDWSLAVLADLYSHVEKKYLAKLEDLRSRTRQELETLAIVRTDLARIGDVVDEELASAAARLRRLSIDALTRVVDSPTASPMLWYQDIFDELARHHRDGKAGCATDLQLRCLAHDVRLHGGHNARNLLLELGELWFRAGEGERNLRLLVGLLEDDPADIWTYNWIAVFCDRVGLAELPVEAARQGLRLIERTGDTQKLEQQLRDRLDKEPQSGSDEAVARWPEAFGALRAALGRSFDAGTRLPILDLCRKLVPEFDTVPVKRPREAPTARSGTKRASRRSGKKRSRRR